MRTITTAQSNVLAAGVPAQHMRVQVYDSNAAAWRDITTWPGTNLVDSASWREDVDSPSATADIVLKREVEKLSLSPFVAASALNRAFNPAASAVPLLALGREVQIDVAVVPMDKAPAAGDWMTVFDGYIDSIDPAAGATVTVSCRDLGARVMDAFIEKERVYSYGSGGLGTSMRVWEPNTAYSLNEYILPATRGTADPGNAKFYKCTTAGTSGTTEPVWPSSSTVNDGTAVHTYQAATSSAGTAVETVMQQILTDQGLSVTLDVPTSPSWSIKQFLQRREGTLEALRALAQQIGWDVRYIWKAASSAFVLRLFVPDRAKSSADRTFAASDYEDVKRLAIDISGIRNVIRVIYSDPADLWPDGTPKRKVVEVSDSTSITAYGRRFAEVSEDSASQIDTVTEATAMANAFLSDCKSPTAEADVAMAQGFPWVELGDLYAFSSNGRHFDSTQTLAVYGWSHEAREGAIKTTFRLRGKPSTGLDRWHQVAVKPAGDGGHVFALFQAAGGVNATVTPVVGGGRVTLGTTPDKLALIEEFEHHVSTSSTYTPSSSTLVAISKARETELADLTPGVTYYHRAVPRTRNGARIVRGQPSKELAFTAGRAQATHINSQLDTSRKPLNGGFETLFTGSIPDYWTTNLSAKLDVMTDSSGVSGSRYIRLTQHASTLHNLYSAQFTITAGVTYRFRVRYKTSAGFAAAAQAVVAYFDETGDGSITTGLVGFGTTVDLTVSTSWTTAEQSDAAPSGGRFAMVLVTLPSGGAGDLLYLDEIEVQAAETGLLGTPAAHAASHASAGSDAVTLAQSQVTNLTTDLAAKVAKAGDTMTGALTISAASTALNLSAVSPTLNVGAYGGGGNAIVRLLGEALLAFYGGGAGAALVFGSSDAAMQFDLQFDAGASSRMHIDGATGNLAVDTNTLYVDAANNRVGVGKTNPAQALDVVGNVVASGTLGGSNLSGTNTGDVAFGTSAGTACQGNDARLLHYVGVPASASAAGVAGDYAIDGSYLYVCQATNTWFRVAIVTW